MFIVHCLSKLKDNGVAVILNFPGILYRKAREGKIRQWLIESNYISKVVHIGGDKFTDTKISTCILVLKKNKTTTDIEFIDDEINKRKIVGFEEIKENDFILSVSNYIQKEEVKEEIDIDLVNIQANEHLFNHIENMLKFNLLLISLGEKIDLIEFINRIRGLLTETENELLHLTKQSLIAIILIQGGEEMKKEVITLRVDREFKDELMKKAKNLGISLNSYIVISLKI